MFNTFSNANNYVHLKVKNKYITFTNISLQNPTKVD